MADLLQGLLNDRSLVRQDKDEWILCARQIFAPGARQNCHVCGKYRFLTQAHHVLPLACQYDKGFKAPDQTYCWLCPTHHAAVHLMISFFTAVEPPENRDRFEMLIDMDEDEEKRVTEVVYAFHKLYYNIPDGMEFHV